MTENVVSGSGCSQRWAATRAAPETAAASTSGPSPPWPSVPVRAAIASARGRSIAAMVSRNSACRAGAEVISASVSRSGSPSSEYCSMSAPTTACSSGSSTGRSRSAAATRATAFRRERDHDRLLAAGEVVVVGARGHPGGLGDVVDANVLRSVFEGQAQRGGAEGFPGGELLALAHAAAVAGAHARSVRKYARTQNCVYAISVYGGGWHSDTRVLTAVIGAGEDPGSGRGPPSRAPVPTAPARALEGRPHGEDDRVRRGGAPRARARHEHPRRRRQGDARPARAATSSWRRSGARPPSPTMVCRSPRRSSSRTRGRRSGPSWSRKWPRRPTTSRVTAPPPPPCWPRRWSARACATWPRARTRWRSSAASRRPSRPSRSSC